MTPSQNSPVSSLPASSFADAPLERLDALLSKAKAAGAEVCEAVFSKSRSLGLSVRKGEIETVERDETTDLGLRVIIGRKQAVVAVSEFSPQTLERLVERAVAMAHLAPDDPFIGLADPALIYKGERKLSELDLYDPTEVASLTLKDRALACEAAGLDFDARLQSDAASSGYGISEWHLLTSAGFQGHHKTSVFYQSARFIATDETGAMERDSDGRTKRYFLDLPPPEETGLIAAERALKSISPRKIASQKAPVIFDWRVSKSLISQFISAISGPSVARGSSFLKAFRHQQVFGADIQILEDPFRLRGLGSCLYDDEGVAVEPRALIKDGVLTDWLLNSTSAKQLGLTSNGHASRSLASPPGVSSHNVTLSPGKDDQATLIRNAGMGMLITNMFGPSLNHDTGDWSAGASGFWFEGGEIQYPVNEITVAGNLKDIFARLIPGSDLEIRGNLDTPSVLIDGLSLGGK